MSWKKMGWVLAATVFIAGCDTEPRAPSIPSFRTPAKSSSTVPPSTVSEESPPLRAPD
jgi:hypothetical protein